MLSTRAMMHALFAAAASLSLGAPAAAAQKADPAAGFPNRPIRIVIPFTPGGQPDIFSRLIGQKVGETLGQQVVVDNRPGAGGMIGSKIVAESNPDGHTLLSISAAHVIGPSVRKLPYDTRRDFAGISMSYNGAYLLVVPPSLGVKSTKEIIALAKSRPGQLNLASAGRGSGTHFAGEFFKFSAGIDVVHVPFKGIPESMNDIMAGRVQLFMAPIASSIPLLRDGRIRVLGVSSPQRLGVLPDVPTIAEGGLKGFRFDSWGAIFVQGKTPRPIVDKLNRAVVNALRQPDIEKRMLALGAVPSPTTPAELDGFVLKELAAIQKIAKLAGIRPE
ncbi:MAG: tripartite tricarboxylate transporter substrate binding protein [Betaproteobacteria bacterium]|nr:tripartite tricarboxylate transporter substrate binding protein [Betaproteobacteria bacterium]